MQDVPVECMIEGNVLDQVFCKPAEPVQPTKPGEVTPQSGGGGTTEPPRPPVKQ